MRASKTQSFPAAVSKFSISNQKVKRTLPVSVTEARASRSSDKSCCSEHINVPRGFEILLRAEIRAAGVSRLCRLGRCCFASATDVTLTSRGFLSRVFHAEASVSRACCVLSSLLLAPSQFCADFPRNPFISRVGHAPSQA